MTGMDLDFGPLFAGGQEKTVQPGVEIVAPGTGADRVYLVRQGRVRVSRISPDGRELTLAIIGPGEILGEVALLDGGDRTATAVAQTQVRLIGLDRGRFLNAIAGHPEHALRLIAALCQRLRQADQMVEELTFLGVKERLRHLIERLEEKKSPSLSELTHQELAEMIGASRESVTRALAELRREHEPGR